MLMWLKNMVGMSLSEEEMKSIPYPEAELTVHITTKTMEAGSVLGGVLIGPLAGLLWRKNTERVARARRYGGRGMIMGLFLGPALTYFHYSKKGYGTEGFYDRSYRLRHNQGQLVVDRSVYVGGLLGAAVGGLSGASNGVNIAVFGAALYNNVIKPRL